MKKLLYTCLIIVVGFFVPDIIMVNSNQHRIVHVENIDSVRMRFYNTPNQENLNSIWASIPYQGNTVNQYDLFVYTWYISFVYEDFSSRNTIYEMLMDTLYDERHYIPCADMIEFAQKIKPTKRNKSNIQ